MSIQSARDPEFSNPIQRVFIILNNGEIDSAYAQYLVSALKEQFLNQGVEIAIHIINPLALDENAHVAEMSAFEPEGILTIIVNGGVMGPYGGMMEIIYDVNFFDATTKVRIWRAKISARGGTGVVEKRMKIMAHDLVSRMKADSLLSSTPRKKKNET